jgi:hypothetical protein
MVNRNIDEMIKQEEKFIKGKLHLDVAKQKYEEIKVPQGIKVAAPKYSEHSYKKKLSYILAATAPVVTVGLLVLFVNMSAAFGEFISRVPLFAPFVEVLRFDIGSEKALEKSFLQTINQTVEDKGIKVTINNIIFDRRKMIVDYSFETKEDYEDLDIGNVEITGANGEALEGIVELGNSSNGKDKNKKVRKGAVDILFKDDSRTFPGEILISFSSFREEGSDYINKKTIEGNWSFKIKLNEAFLKVKPKVLNIYKEVKVDKINFIIDYFKIYPTISDIRVVLDKDSEYKVVGFKKPKLVDDKGREYISRSAGFSNSENIIHFESNYFRDFNNMSFEAEGVYYMPKKDQFIEVDLENKKIIDSNDYKLEIYNLSTENYYNKNDEEYISIGFKVTDEEFYNTLSKDSSYVSSYLQLSEAFDENNNKYYINSSSETSTGGVNKDQILFVRIKKPVNMPEKLKFKVSTSNKDITAPFKVKLK